MHFVQQTIIDTIPDRIRLLKLKASKAFPLELFYRKGNGIRTLIRKTGRLTDFKGIFVVYNSSRIPVLSVKSDHVLSDIQKLARSKRVLDSERWRILQDRSGINSSKKQYLIKSLRVSCIVIARDSERFLLHRAIKNHML